MEALSGMAPGLLEVQLLDFCLSGVMVARSDLRGGESGCLAATHKLHLGVLRGVRDGRVERNGGPGLATIQPSGGYPTMQQSEFDEVAR